MGPFTNQFIEINEVNPVLKAIVNRRLNRVSQSTSVSRNLIEILLESGMRITTSHQMIPWSFVVIQDDDYLRYLYDYAQIFNQLDRDMNQNSYNDTAMQSNDESSSTLVIMYANIDLPFSLSDCWQAIENILLASSALGLSVSLNCTLIKLLNSGKVKQELQVPEELSVMYAINVDHNSNSHLPMANQKPMIWSWISKC